MIDEYDVRDMTPDEIKLNLRMNGVVVDKPRCPICGQLRFVEWQGVRKITSMKIENTYLCHQCYEVFTE